MTLALAAMLTARGQERADGLVSPLDFGLREAASGMGRYYALYNAHTYAFHHGLEVTYDGIDTVNIELPPSWRSIPLGPNTDFGGLVLYVTNHARHGALFSLSTAATELAMDKAMVDGLDFRTVPQLSTGTCLLILNDRHPWTERRGYGYLAYRSDLLLLHDGMAENRPVMPWNSDSTLLKASYCQVDTSLKTVRGLTMHRQPGCMYRTYCLAVSCQYNVLIEDMHVSTPRSEMIADAVFSINNSARVTVRDVTVDGTYSGYGRTRNYGYAFSLGNDYDTRYQNIQANGNWGVFGSNNMSKTLLEDCDIDRFDIHCYGRDVTLRRCYLHGRQTIFGSMYGTVEFDSCRFEDYVPVRIRSSYNAYTPFDVVIRHCSFRLTPSHHALISIMLLDTADNPRPELKEKCWPNLLAEDLTVEAPWTVRRLDIYDPIDNLRDLKREIGYISNVQFRNLRTVGTNGRERKLNLRLFSHEVRTKQPVSLTIE